MNCFGIFFLLLRDSRGNNTWMPRTARASQGDDIHEVLCMNEVTRILYAMSWVKLTPCDYFQLTTTPSGKLVSVHLSTASGAMGQRQTVPGTNGTAAFPAWTYGDICDTAGRK